MSVNERRAEIMKILVARRQTTVPLLAQELCVCCNTVRNIHTIPVQEVELCATTFMHLHWTILWRRVPGMVAVLE